MTRSVTIRDYPLLSVTLISQQVSDGALRHHPAARLPGRVHSEHAHAPSPPSRVQSFPLARAATSRRSRAVIPTLTALALPCRSARLLHRSRRPSPTPPTSPTQSNMSTTNQLEVRWGHDGRTWALRSAYTGGTHVASVCRCAFCGDVSSGAGEPAHRLGHAHGCRSLFGEGWDHRRRSCRVHGHVVARWRNYEPSMGGGCCACGRVP